MNKVFTAEQAFEVARKVKINKTLANMNDIMTRIKTSAAEGKTTCTIPVKITRDEMDTLISLGYSVTTDYTGSHLVSWSAPTRPSHRFSE